jgi:hypothetical protein
MGIRAGGSLSLPRTGDNDRVIDSVDPDAPDDRRRVTKPKTPPSFDPDPDENLRSWFNRVVVGPGEPPRDDPSTLP